MLLYSVVESVNYDLNIQYIESKFQRVFGTVSVVNIVEVSCSQQEFSVSSSMQHSNLYHKSAKKWKVNEKEFFLRHFLPRKSFNSTTLTAYVLRKPSTFSRSHLISYKQTNENFRKSKNIPQTKLIFSN